MVGGAIAVGTAVIQLGAAAGAHVVAVAGGPEKGELVPRARRRADRPPAEDLFDRVMALTDEHGADVCVDMIGGEGTETMWTCMAREGRYVAVGLQRRPRVGAHRAPAAQGVDGQLLGDRRDAGLQRHARRVPPLRAQHVPAGGRARGARGAARARGAGKIRPVIGRRIGMDEVAAALDDHDQRRTSGRTVVDVANR